MVDPDALWLRYLHELLAGSKSPEIYINRTKLAGLVFLVTHCISRSITS